MESVDADVRAVVERFNAAWDAHDLEATLALVTEDCVFESARPGVNGARVVGRQALAKVWAPSFARGGAPFDIEDTIVSGDRVVQLWAFTDGGRTVRGVDVLRVRDGLLAEKFGYVKA